MKRNTIELYNTNSKLLLVPSNKAE